MTPLIHNLFVLGYGGGNTLWLFNGQARGEGLARILAPGYFLPARDLLRPGDHLHISAIDGAAVAAVSPHGNLAVLSRALYEAIP